MWSKYNWFFVLLVCFSFTQSSYSDPEDISQVEILGGVLPVLLDFGKDGLQDGKVVEHSTLAKVLAHVFQYDTGTIEDDPYPVELQILALNYILTFAEDDTALDYLKFALKAAHNPATPFLELDTSSEHLKPIERLIVMDQIRLLLKRKEFYAYQVTTESTQKEYPNRALVEGFLANVRNVIKSALRSAMKETLVDLSGPGALLEGRERAMSMEATVRAIEISPPAVQFLDSLRTDVTEDIRRDLAEIASELMDDPGESLKAFNASHFGDDQRALSMANLIWTVTAGLWLVDLAIWTSASSVDPAFKPAVVQVVTTILSLITLGNVVFMGPKMYRDARESLRQRFIKAIREFATLKPIHAAFCGLLLNGVEPAE